MVKIIDKPNLEFDYSKYDFKDDIKYVFETPEGLSEEVIREISAIKGEPEWMLEFRLKAFRIFQSIPLPTWGGDLSRIDFDKIRYYLRPTEKAGHTWEEVPDEIKETFDKLGIPEAERKFLAGVGAQYDSELVYHSLAKELEEQGVIFLGTDQALQEYPEIFKKYFGTVVPPADNKFAALNSAVWSGGSFVYVPKNTKVEFPLQAYFRINAQNAGQFERTLIVVEEGSDVHYIEGCFLEGAMVRTRYGEKPIELIENGEEVLTHNGRYQLVYHTMKRKYVGTIYKIRYYGDSSKELVVTEDHPLLVVPREKPRERNKSFQPVWKLASEVHPKDYLAIPVPNRDLTKSPPEILERFIPIGNGSHGYSDQRLAIKIDKNFFRLIGYYLSEGHVQNEHYLTFSFNENEVDLLNDTKYLIQEYFGYDIYENKPYQSGITLVLSKTLVARFFALEFGSTVYEKRVPEWVIHAPNEYLEELVKGMWLGDGSYDPKKNMFRFSTINLDLAYLFRDSLLRLGIAASINKSDRSKSGRADMYTVVVSSPWNEKFGKIVGVDAKNGSKSGSPFKLTEHFLFVPIKSIEIEEVETEVYNLSVENDETYVCEGVISHNCTAPIYSTNSLHAAVVEVIAKKNAHLRYTTVQNWSSNVYNLVTKRAHAYENAFVEWVDGNIGSALTMKYPAVYLLGRGARAEVISIAYAGKGQVQDAGAKAVHLAPETHSRIINKSVSKAGGKTVYRGLIHVAPGCVGSKVSVQCDALLLDNLSSTDTFPYLEIQEDDVTITHEATVGKISEDVLFYAMTRGIPETEALNMVVMGFLEPFTKELPLEYAVELNRLIQLEMEGAIG